MATVGVKGLNVQCDVTLCLFVALHNHDVAYIKLEAIQSTSCNTFGQLTQLQLSHCHLQPSASVVSSSFQACSCPPTS